MHKGEPKRQNFGFNMPRDKKHLYLTPITVNAVYLIYNLYTHTHQNNNIEEYF